MHDPVFVCVCVCILRCGQQAFVLGGLQTAPDSQRGSERSSPPDAHVVRRDTGTPLRSGRLRGSCTTEFSVFEGRRPHPACPHLIISIVYLSSGSRGPAGWLEMWLFSVCVCVHVSLDRAAEHVRNWRPPLGSAKRHPTHSGLLMIIQCLRVRDASHHRRLNLVLCQTVKLICRLAVSLCLY